MISSDFSGPVIPKSLNSFFYGSSCFPLYYLIYSLYNSSLLYIQIHLQL